MSEPFPTTAAAVTRLHPRKTGMESFQELWQGVSQGAFVFSFFIIVCVLVTMLYAWTVNEITHWSSFAAYHLWWLYDLAPFVGAFVTGNLIRSTGGAGIHLSALGTFGIGILAFFTFSFMTWADMNMAQQLYSAWLPSGFTYTIEPCLVTIPVIGTLGVVFEVKF
ncbi:MAG: hypothetical protein SFZ03_05135 [Candidatus Melainabacteria bacterium]|nr:hypothetical protein [Candidatus Melainabacteria bacterium]